MHRRPDRWSKRSNRECHRDPAGCRDANTRTPPLLPDLTIEGSRIGSDFALPIHLFADIGEKATGGPTPGEPYPGDDSSEGNNKRNSTAIGDDREYLHSNDGGNESEPHDQPSPCGCRVDYGDQYQHYHQDGNSPPTTGPEKLRKSFDDHVQHLAKDILCDV